MTYEGIEYAIRAGLGRDEWVLLISFPDNVGSNPSVVKFSGSRNDALAEATAANTALENFAGGAGLRRKFKINPMQGACARRLQAAASTLQTAQF